MQYQGYEINVTDDMLFSVKGPGIANNYDSIKEAKAAVDGLLRIVAVEQAKSFTADVLDQAGKVITIRGISRANGKLLGAEKGYVYPNVQWVKEALKRLGQLRQEMDELDGKLRPLRTDVDYAYGRIEADMLSSKLSRLQKELADKLEAAKNG